MTADTAAVTAAAPEDRRRMLPIAEAAEALDVSVKYLKDLHRADPCAYPAERIGTRWRVPRAWVEAMAAWPRGATS